MGHESYSRKEQVEGSSNRSFGITFAAVFALIAIVPPLFGGTFRVWVLAIGAMFGVLAFTAPAVLAPLNRIWLRFGLLLHRIVSPIVLGIMFFLVITPIGLVMRAFGKDPLRLKRDAAATSYWIPRDPSGPPSGSLKDQF